ncbi:hypothetical protein Landi51_04942 [Colletotrichum acutatum]
MGSFGGGGAAPASIPAPRAPSSQAPMPTPTRPSPGPSSPSKLRSLSLAISCHNVLSTPLSHHKMPPSFLQHSSPTSITSSPAGPIGSPQYSVMNFSSPQHSSRASHLQAHDIIRFSANQSQRV